MYQINRILCVSDGTFTAYNIELQTDDLEKTRSELHSVYQCERIDFEYTELKENIK